MPVDARTGWGIYGLNLALQAISHQIIPVLSVRPDWGSINPLQGGLLVSADALHANVAQALAQSSDEQIVLNCPAIYALSNQMQGAERADAWIGTRNLAIVVFENTSFTLAEIERTKPFDKLITGSSWNAQILKNHGLKNVSLVLQGVDTTLFYPGPRSGLWKNHFVIFSGGKLEYRKGQDLVIAALKIFQQKYPETILAFAWHNAFPLTMSEIQTSGLIDGMPGVSPQGEIDFSPWLTRQGIKTFLNLGNPLNWHMPPILREVDVAIFPSRAEGATNFAAMECLACGIPTILSANTGHLDILSDEICYPLRAQAHARPTEFFTHIEGWGESSVDEILDTLERVYRDREEARRKGRAAAEAMKKIAWENQFNQLLGEIESITFAEDRNS